MCVVSTVAAGRLAVDEFDRLDGARAASPADYRRPFPCAPRRRRRVTPADPPAVALRPPPAAGAGAGGHLHEVTAEADAVLVDVIAPPYSDAAGRPCHYFRRVVPAGDGSAAVASAAAAAVAAGRGGPTAAAAAPAAGRVVWLLGAAAPGDYYTVSRPYSGPDVRWR
jgi:hypothetical protein